MAGTVTPIEATVVVVIGTGAVVAPAGVEAGVLLGLPSATDDGIGWTSVKPVELTAC